MIEKRFLYVIFLTCLTSLVSAAPNPGVVVKQVEVQDVTSRFDYVGRVEAREKVDIRARVSGYLQKRHFIEGAQVKKGDLLFEVEPDSYAISVKQMKAELASAEASLIKAKADLKRQSNLRKRGVASQSDLDQAQADEAIAKANVLIAKASLAEAELNLSYTKIYSPIDGVTSRAVYSQGNLVDQESGALTTITSMDPIYVRVAVSEKALLDARRNGVDLKNPPVDPTLKLSDGSDYGTKGVFNYFDTEVDESTDTIIVRAEFQNKDSILLPGEFVQVMVTPKERVHAPVVPQSAVQKDQQGFFVLVVKSDNTVEKRSVDLGQQNQGNWAVTKGLSEGEKVIIEGLQKVRPGATVNPTEEQ